MKIESSEPVGISFVKKYMSKLKLKEETATYEQMQALEYVNTFSKNDVKETNALIKKLVKEVPKLDKETAIKIVDIMPVKPNTVRAICVMNKNNVEDAEIEKILGIIKSK